MASHQPSRRRTVRQRFFIKILHKRLGYCTATSGREMPRSRSRTNPNLHIGLRLTEESRF